MASIRIARLQNQIRGKIAMILARDMADPRMGLVTITRVKLAGDMSKAEIFWSCLEEGGARTRVTAALTSARGFIQREVARDLKTRAAPHLEFIFDPSIEGAIRMSALLKEHAGTVTPAGDAGAASAPPGPATDAPTDAAAPPPPPPSIPAP